MKTVPEATVDWHGGGRKAGRQTSCVAAEEEEEEGRPTNHVV